MKFNLMKLLTPNLEGLSIEYVKKSKYLISMNIVVFLLYFFAGTLRGILAGDYAYALAQYTASGLIILSLVLIKKRKFVIASNLTLIITAILLVTVVYMDKFTSLYQMYRGAFLIMMILMLGSLIVFEKFQIIIIIVFCFLSFGPIYFVKVKPILTEDTVRFAFSSYVATFIAIIVASFMAYFSVANIKDIVKVAEEESELNKNKFLQLQKVLNSSKEGMKIGDKLRRSSDTTLKLIREINDRMEDIKVNTKKLSENILDTSNLNKDIISAAKAVKELIVEHNQNIENSSVNIKKMNETASEISDIIKKNEASIHSLLNIVQEGEEQMERSIQSIQKISQSAKNMMEIIKLIDEVAERTNVLALNAGIEASHAGNAGAGFAIVAKEIKKLSEETKNNTKTISRVMKENLQLIEEATQNNKKTGEYFNKITSEMKLYSKSIEDITKEIMSLSSKNAEVSNAVNLLVNVAKKIDNSMNSVNDIISKSQEAISNIIKMSEDINLKINDVINGFISINQEAEEINDIGIENVKNIKNLEESLLNINK